MTDIRINARVECTDGPCGKVSNIIVIRATRSVSHLVVENQKFPQESTRLVPINKILNATPGQINLSCTKKEVEEMQPFMVTHYIQETGAGKASSVGSNYFFPYAMSSFGTIDEYAAVVNNTGYNTINEKNIPEDDLTVTPGMEIRASDGKIGKLDELVVDPGTGEITHLLMREGHLWGKKDIVIPLSAVASARGGFVRLKISKKEVEVLPAVSLKT
jgi:sporulation protein YlmC with PRC-barrel domain